ncbi:MAG: hypothetical protein U0794_01955 [Isosphaeraceae bacterium]
MADAAQTYPIFEIPYLRLFPWLRLFHAPSSAAEPKRLMLALAGIILLSAGWSAIDVAAPGVNTWAPNGLPTEGTPAPSDLAGLAGRLIEPAALVVRPFILSFKSGAPAADLLGAAAATLWAVAVWSLFGGAIARIAAFRVARGERLGLFAAMRYVLRKLPALLSTPLLPLTGVVLMGAGLALFGLLYRIPGGFGRTTAGVLAFLPLLGGLVLTLILTGLGFGWPLMTASVAAEDDDAFDAMSRSYAYVRQRPWLYLLYGLIALAAGIGGLLFVDLFAQLVVRLAGWGLAFGGGPAAVLAFYQPEGPFRDAALDHTMAASAHAFWLGLVGLLARAWVFSYFWTAAETIYLLLRRDVDSTPINLIACDSGPSLLAQAAAGGPTLARPGFAKSDAAATSTVPGPHAPVGPSSESAEPA